MLYSNFFDDYDIFLDGEWFTRLSYLTYDEAVAWTRLTVREHPGCNLEIRLAVVR